jgi:hypothetical protein
MSVSRRSFFTAVAGAIAGAVASKALAVEPAAAPPPVAARPTNVVEFCRKYLTKEKIEPWQEDILLQVQATKLTASVNVPACMIEDCMAQQVDRECWSTFGVRKWDAKIDIKSLKAVMDSLPKYNDGLMTINDVRSLEGLNSWRPSRRLMSLPEGWGMTQCGLPKGVDCCCSRPIRLRA